ncbi:hypothetical protein CANARDRAFT_26045 [[Candida] arabinofermentans NRRL YB-2248]|uniref:25S rRNA adenine-N(1) methyltransferase n=1 Tax=[Candida] arabinofermentans NRRL YB-2248 TaxID=983967 RepID=A0A1E4T7X4_9ASCO|nr:hypothetical protein CANARDRAFT_26045 [[Candida] arabinofermentans NRRL YB-2248]
MVQKTKRHGLLSKASKSITSSVPAKRPSSLKPLRARQLIRRFHILLKNKSHILGELSRRFGMQLMDENYETVLKTKKKNMYKEYSKSKEKIESELKVNKTPSTEDFKLDGQSDLQLISKLGEIDGEIKKRGGLDAYQSASTQGQDSKRGGDSSKKLIEWLNELGLYQNSSQSDLTAIEIGCLSSKNMISTSKIFKEVTKLDLNSQEPGTILQHDFMDRPIPKDPSERFNLVSCSLVVNFVPNPELRGEMMKHITQFFHTPSSNSPPSLLFFVLPLPCISNSRYFDNDQMEHLMKNLGFSCLKFYESNKLAYWLYEWKGNKYVNNKFTMKKKELHKGSKRNNFCIVIK